MLHKRESRPHTPKSWIQFRRYSDLIWKVEPDNLTSCAHFANADHFCVYTPLTILDPIPMQSKLFNLELFYLNFVILLKWYCTIRAIPLFKRMDNTRVYLGMAFIRGIGKNSFDHKYVVSLCDYCQICNQHKQCHLVTKLSFQL